MNLALLECLVEFEILIVILPASTIGLITNTIKAKYVRVYIHQASRYSLYHAI